MKMGAWRPYAFMAMLVPSAALSGVGALLLLQDWAPNGRINVWFVPLCVLVFSVQIVFWTFVLRVGLKRDGNRFVLVPRVRIKSGH